MISWTGLLTKTTQDCDQLRYASGNGHNPKIVVYNITSSCNLDCRHCYFQATDSAAHDELTQQEARGLIEDLANFGVAVLLFSGGEPLLRGDIFTLANFAQGKGMRTILSTNGTLITKEVARQIQQAGFAYVGISLDGLEKTNDWFRKKPGAFSRALSGIKNCQSTGLKVGLRFTVTKDNVAELPAIFDLVEEEQIRRFCIYHLVYSGRGSSLQESDLTHQQRRKIMELIWEKTMEFHRKGLNVEVLTVDNHADAVWLYLKLKKTDPTRAKQVLKLLKIQGGNSSGINIAAVDNCGRISADQFLRAHILGNIRQNKFSAVWQDQDNKLLQELRNRAPLLKGRCQRCAFMSICNGNFRARAEAVSGNIWAEDPACYLTEEEILS